MPASLIGLSNEAALLRHNEFGANVLGGTHTGPSAWSLVVRQLANPLLWLLAVAAGIAWFLLDEQLDALVILGSIGVNIGLGFLQEYKAERTLQALRNLVEPYAWVLRAGQRRKIKATLVVPDDLLLLSAGDKIAADGRLLECEGLEINEAALTGESFGVDKTVGSRVFAGTTIVRGHGVVKVTAIGSATKMGQIAELVRDTRAEPTPLERRLARLTQQLSLILGSLTIGLFLMVLLQGRDLDTAIVATIALAVAVIPEGLPIMVTLMLAIGMERLAKAHATVRRLAAVETLGSITILAVDKTGTITTGELTVAEVLGRDPEQILITALLASDIGTKTLATPDPLEKALAHYADTIGLNWTTVTQEAKRLASLPFDARRGAMAVEVERHRQTQVVFKGAPEAILAQCILSAGEHQEIAQEVRKLARRGLRMVAVAVAENQTLAGLTASPTGTKQLTWLGLIALTDPVRPDAAEAIKTARALGIRTLIITGDHPATARTIAWELDLPITANQILTGAELRQLSHTALKDRLRRTVVCARVLPEEKLVLVEALQSLGEIVAMTGDGINDGPALKKADIGVAMGASGTEVAKETADLILLDDRLLTIVAAVREGRTIFANLQKGIIYLLGTNIAELLVVLGATLVGWPLPLAATQILWMNLVTDTLPVAGLAFEQQSDHSNQKREIPFPLLNPFMWRRILLTGAAISLGSLLIFALKLREGVPLPAMQTLVFTAIVVMQLANVYTLRTFRQFLLPWQMINHWLTVAVAGAIVLQFLALTKFHVLLKTTLPTGRDWFLLLSMTGLVIALIELHKYVERKVSA